MGGLILDVGEKTIDLSVASRLTKYDSALNCECSIDISATPSF